MFAQFSNRLLATLAILIFACGSAQADVILNSFDVRSHESGSAGSFTIQNSYRTGYSGSSLGDEFYPRRGSFIFYVPLGTPQIATAMLRIYSPNGSYQSVDPTELLNINTLSSATVQQILTNQDPLTFFSQLTSGPLVGSRTFTSADNNTYADIPLSSSAVISINAAIGQQIGFASDVPTITHWQGEYLFYNTNASTLSSFPVQLVLTPVPEPGSFVLLGLGFTAGAIRVRRRNQQSIV